MKTLVKTFFIVAFMGGLVLAQTGPVYVSEPSVPTLSPPVRDLPPYDKSKEIYGLEMARRNDWGATVPDQQGEPWYNPLIDRQLQSLSEAISKTSKTFGTPIINVEGYTSPASPPDTTGDVGLNRFVQATNAGGYGSLMHIYQKDGTFLQTVAMESLASSSPCNSGYCDPIVLYDQIADRWVISEFADSGSYFCVYVSQTSDPQGSWYAYTFGDLGYGGPPDYPKYGVWPQDSDNDGNYDEGSYLIGVNAGSSGQRDIYALDREKMLQGLGANYQKFSVPELSAFGFQLLLPAGHEGPDPPPNGEPAIFMRPVDTELHSGFSCSPEPCDLMDVWALSVDWNTPSNSTLTQLPSIEISEYDHTICGTSGNWNCMPQPGTTQKIDPIREPIHFPLQYRNNGSYQSITGCFAEDVDGTDHAAVHWFEMRKTTGDWYLVQDGVLGGENGVHRSVCSAAMDSSGNIAVGYTRTGDNAPYYPSIYYSGRLESDTSGTMPYYDNTIHDASTSKTDNERWGDYSGIGVDPEDDCTFWYTTEYGGSGHTRIASFKFDACGCIMPGIPSGLTASANGDNSIHLTWNQGSPSATTFNVYRAKGSCPQTTYTLIASGITTTNYTDNTVSGGITYAYVVTGVDDTGNCETDYSNCSEAQTTGSCTEAPTFAGLQSVTNPGNSICTLDLSWNAATAWCGGPVEYQIYRDTVSGFTPGPGNLLATTTATSYSDANNLVSGTTYYYIVRAVDQGNGVEDGNTVEKSGAPYGPGGGTQVLFSDDFESGNAWTFSGGGEWEVGTPQGLGGEHGNPDPTSAYEGSNVLGNDLSGTGSYPGDYEASLTATHATSPAIDASNASSVQLEFQRYLNVETPTYDGASILVSNDGTNYSNVWSSSETITDSSWSLQSYDISSIADGQSTVYIRFQIDKSDGSWQYSGWNIDALQVTGWVDAACTTGSGCSNNPTVNVTPDGPLTLCEGDSQVLTANLSGGTGPFTYQWTEDGVDISGATGSTYTASSSGTHEYNCKVRGDGCPDDAMDGAPTQIAWQSAPTFDGITSVTNPQNSTCTLDLAWNPASSPCPGPITYNIYRSTTSPVNPQPSNRIASGVTGTSYSDSNGLVSGTTYYYVVRAYDASTGVEETNTAEKSGAPTGPGSGNQTFLSEDFSGGIPTTWTVIDGGTGGGSAPTWTTDNPCTRSATSPIVDPFAIVDSDCAGTSSTQDEELITPTIDVSSASTVTLSFDQYFYWYTSGGDEIGDVDVKSSLTGGSWVNVFQNQGASSPNPDHQDIDITTQAAGALDLQIRFHYYNGDYDWYWMVDNVQVTGDVVSSCTTGSTLPGEITGETWPDKDTYSWNEDSNCSSGYNLYRGILADLPNLLDGNVDSCLRFSGATSADNTADLTGDDPSSVPGNLYWYLITGKNASGEGTAGYATAGERVVNDSGACP